MGTFILPKGIDNMKNNKWHTDKNPGKRGHYLVTSLLNWYHGGNMEPNKNGSPRSITVAYYDETDKVGGRNCWNVPYVIAWQELPEVYLNNNIHLLDLPNE